MSVLLRLVVPAMAVAMVLPAPEASADLRSARPATVAAPAKSVAPSRYLTTDLEYYLDDEGIAYIRPGLKIQVVNITDVAPGKKPSVELKFTDDLDQPLDRNGKVTPGAISASFVLAWYNPQTRLYTSYTVRTQTTPAGSPAGPGVRAIQAAADSGGSFTDLEVGHSIYRFGTTLPANLDATKTTTLGIYATRNLTEQIDKNYYDNVEHDFRPDGGTIAAGDKWDKIRDADSCLNCHDPLALHGGSRREVKLCVLCHQPQTTDPDTGNTVDMAVMIHKIHSPGLLSEPYIIYGNQQSRHDFSHVTYPQDVRNCDNCHEGTNTSNKPTQSDVYYTKPGQRACGSCHDEVDFSKHAGGQADDSNCANCHVPDSGQEFDASIKGAHTIPLKSKQLKGVTAVVDSVSNLEPGKKPTVVMKLTNTSDGSAIDGSKLNSFSPMIGGPTSSYNKYYRESGAARAVFNATTGTTTYTFTNSVPADAHGTWVVSGDFYRDVAIKRADGEPDITVRDAAVNPIKYVALSGGTATPRRTAVTIAQCNLCHDRLAFHGDQRLNIDECVICHNPKESDVARRPANAGNPESISFQRLVHRIHTGEDLTQDFTVYGFGNTPHNYNEVLYPGDRRNCASCHTGDSQQLPGIGESVITLRDYFSPQGPGTAACLGCHDNRDAAAHAFLNTANFPGSTEPAEACATCHGPGRDHSVDEAHAR